MVDQNTPPTNQPDPTNLGTLVITGFTGNARLLVRRISENSTIEVVSTIHSGTQTSLDIAFPRNLTPPKALRDLAFGLNEFDVTVQGMKAGSVPVLVVALSIAKTPKLQFFRRPPRPQEVQRTETRSKKPFPTVKTSTTLIPTTPPPKPTSPRLSEKISENLYNREITANALDIIGRGWKIFTLLVTVTLPVIKTYVRRVTGNFGSQAKSRVFNFRSDVPKLLSQIFNRGASIIAPVSLVISVVVDGIFGSTHDDKPKQ